MQTSSSRRPTRRFPAFTLIELLVVITIIGVLIAILLPALAAAFQMAQTVNCQSNLKQIAMAALDYASDNKGAILPTTLKATDNTVSYWCDILANPANPYVSANNTSNLGATTASTDEGIFRCPLASSSIITTATTISSPDAPQAQATLRLGYAGTTPFKVDCAYFWNGYTGNTTAIMARYPSLALDATAPMSTRTTQVHYLDEIKQRSQLVMAADGVLFDGDTNPARIAVRHQGPMGTCRTNIVYYDGHADSMDRYPNPDWAHEVVTDSTLQGIMSRTSTGATTAKLDSTNPPYFTLPRR